MSFLPLPVPLDSGLRWNDGWGAGVTYGGPECRVGIRIDEGMPRDINPHCATGHMGNT